MKLGIMVTSARHLDQVVGIARAAQRKGHAVTVFATDRGTRLLAEPRFAALSALPGVALSYCDLSAQRYGGRPAGLPEAVVSGSQLENAAMASESDRVIVL